MCLTGFIEIQEFDRYIGPGGIPNVYYPCVDLWFTGIFPDVL